MKLPRYEDRWEPFQRGAPATFTHDEVHRAADAYNMTYEEMLPVYEKLTKDVIWINNRYQVNIDYEPDTLGEGWPKIIHLSIKRRDKAPLHDWRDLQRIKNELVGPEHEAIELYPAESRVVDTANQYHLWCFADDRVRIPVGWPTRLVTEVEANGSRQRPFRKQKP